MKRAYAPEFERHILCVIRKMDDEWAFIFEDELHSSPYPIVYRGERPYDSYEWEDEAYD